MGSRPKRGKEWLNSLRSTPSRWPQRRHGGLLGALLEKTALDAVLVPCKVPYKKDERIVMQTLVSDRSWLDHVDPFAPVATSNAAKQLSSLTYEESGKKLAAVLRSCEVRAFIELVKLKQGRLEDLLLIGIDCTDATKPATICATRMGTTTRRSTSERHRRGEGHQAGRRLRHHRGLQEL